MGKNERFFIPDGDYIINRNLFNCVRPYVCFNRKGCSGNYGGGLDFELPILHFDYVQHRENYKESRK